jgi:hypothetical protein
VYSFQGVWLLTEGPTGTRGFSTKRYAQSREGSVRWRT